MFKKRLLAVLLTVAMLVALSPVGAHAATETVDGTTYITVKTAQELKSVLSSGRTALLKNDIVLDSSYSDTMKVTPGAVLDGNGYSITYTGTRTAPLFRFAAGTSLGKALITFRNVSIGTKENPMTITGGHALFTEATADTCHVLYQNVDFFVKGTSLTGSKAGGLYSTLTGLATFSGCTLDADLTSSMAGGLLGGWIGEISGGELVMSDCVTRGTIQGSASCVGGVAGQAGAGTSRFTNCVNLATITGPSMVGGFVGNIGTGAFAMYYTACKNYGEITSTGTGYNSMAGGLLGRATNRKDQGNQRLRVFYDCVNYGTITAGGRAGGFVASSHDYDTDGQSGNYLYYTFDDCINYGSVNGSLYAGGMIGAASPVTYRAEITDCINLGKITSANGYAGNVAGILCNSVITGGYAAGVVTTKLGTDVLVPQNAGTYTLQAGSYANQAWTVTKPTVSNVKYIGSSASVDAGITKVTSQALSAALQELSALCGMQLIKADASDTDAYVVPAEPALRGVQQSVAETDGCVDLRFVAGIHTMDAYESVGMYVTVYQNGQKEELTRPANRVYTSLNDVAKNGDVSRVTASSLASKYLCAATVKGLSLSGDVVIKVTPFAKTASGTEYVGESRVISFRDGVYRAEAMLLNDVLLEDYAIVYGRSDTLSEELLAKRMADKIAELTGVRLPVLADNKTTQRTAKLLIGKTTQTTVSVTGRTIRTQNNPNTIVISGTDTAQLSESITYFLELLEEKMLAGNHTWEIASSVSVPVDTTVTMMAYNMGARNSADIKEAEWDLIVDYLPDIWTSQEPWAGFLDDFMNDYAVKPSTDFVASSSDDDVMVTDVNNKCFTGDGYYGVYWGAPRWVPGDANMNGKASYSVILYAKDRFTVDESRSGTFWLSPNANVSGSTFPGSQYTRCATYATMTDRNTNKTFTVVNVHLDFVPQTQLNQINVLLTELKTRVGENMPIFVTGDMNSKANSSPIALYKNNSIMRMTAMDEVADRAYRVDSNIDWFFTNHPEQVEVAYYNNCYENTFLNNLWNSSMIMGMPSDHPAIYTEFKFR